MKHDVYVLLSIQMRQPTNRYTSLFICNNSQIRLDFDSWHTIPLCHFHCHIHSMLCASNLDGMCMSFELGTKVCTAPFWYGHTQFPFQLPLGKLKKWQLFIACDSDVGMPFIYVMLHYFNFIECRNQCMAC